MHGADTPNAGFTSQTVSLNRNSDPLAPLPRLTTPARPEIALLRGNHDIQKERARSTPLEDALGLLGRVLGFTTLSRVDCHMQLSINSAGAVGMLACDARMEDIRVLVTLQQWGSEEKRVNDRTCNHCSYLWATIPQALTSGNWIAFTWGWPTGYYPDGPYPDKNKYFAEENYNAGP